MARKETTTCDACGAEIPREHVHLRINWHQGGGTLMSYAAYVEDVRPIDTEMRELFKDPKDFCNLLCVQRWIESRGPAPLP
jgi:hypothetical protein